MSIVDKSKEKIWLEVFKMLNMKRQYSTVWKRKKKRAIGSEYRGVDPWRFGKGSTKIPTELANAFLVGYIVIIYIEISVGPGTPLNPLPPITACKIVTSGWLVYCPHI